MLQSSMLNALCLGNSSPCYLDAAQKGLLAEFLHYTDFTEGETIFKIANIKKIYIYIYRYSDEMLRCL